MKTTPIERSADGKPANGSDRYSTRGGHVDSAMAALQFRWLQFVDPYAGAPALARWLANEHACREFRYEFNFAGGYLDEGDAGAIGAGAD